MNAFWLLTVVAVVQGFVIPPPRGLVNDFAGVIDAAHAARIERVAAYVRDRSGGEIAVVTLPDLGGRDVGEIALRIGREWGVGARAAIGDRRRNAGAVILVVPKERAADNRGRVFIATGQGAEGFIPDGGAGDIWREAMPQLRAADYGAAIELLTYRVAERFAAEFAFSMDSVAAIAPASAPAPRGRSRVPVGVIVAVVFMFVILPALGARRALRGRRGSFMRGALPWIVLDAMMRSGGGRSRGWSHRGGGGSFGGWGGGGGGGGGGFGGFGGGGGFSGGGSGGSW